MYFGTLEIESIENNIAILKNGKQIEITESNKSLLSEAPVGGSDLQFKWIGLVTNDLFRIISQIDYMDKEDRDDARKKVIIQIIDMLSAHNIRMSDMMSIFQTFTGEIRHIIDLVSTTVESKDEEISVKYIGKEKLEALAEAFGATEPNTSLSARAIRFNDIFNT